MIFVIGGFEEMLNQALKSRTLDRYSDVISVPGSLAIDQISNGFIRVAFSVDALDNHHFDILPTVRDCQKVVTVTIQILKITDTRIVLIVQL